MKIPIKELREIDKDTNINNSIQNDNNINTEAFLNEIQKEIKDVDIFLENVMKDR
jgi:hypothetical protein